MNVFKAIKNIYLATMLAIRLYKFYLNPPNISVLVTDDKDLRELAVGRWELFKAVNVPAFRIGLTRDYEAALQMITFDLIARGDILTGRQLLIQTNVMIKVCGELAAQGNTILNAIEQGVLTDLIKLELAKVYKNSTDK